MSRSAAGPSVGIGVPARNEERHIGTALESLLAQTYMNFRVVVTDNCSTDRTAEIVQRIASGDPRVRYVRLPECIGAAENFRTAFRECGDVEYFAWAGGHDMHHPRWLEAMVAALEESPDAVLAYPLAKRIADDGSPIDLPSPLFDTSGKEIDERIRALVEKGEGFGNMAYGLFRAEALARAGVYRDLLLPDVVLFAELTLQGSFKQVREELWYRRFLDPISLPRQQRSLFTRPPWYSRLPWPAVNAAALAWSTVLTPDAGSVRDRWRGVRLCAGFLKRHGGRYLVQAAAQRAARVLWIASAYRRMKLRQHSKAA